MRDGVRYNYQFIEFASEREDATRDRASGSVSRSGAGVVRRSGAGWVAAPRARTGPGGWVGGVRVYGWVRVLLVRLQIGPSQPRTRTYVRPGPSPHSAQDAPPVRRAPASWSLAPPTHPPHRD